MRCIAHTIYTFLSQSLIKLIKVLCKSFPCFKSGLGNISTACLVKKILLEQSHTHWLTYCLQLHLCCNGRAEYLQRRTSGLQSQRYLLFKPLQKVFVKPIFKSLMSMWDFFFNEINDTPIKKNQLKNFYWTLWGMRPTLKEIKI